MLRKSRPPPSCFLIRSLESRYLSCPPQQGHPGIFSLLLTKNTVCLIANKRILCYNEHGFYQISEYATVQEGALRFFSFCRIMTVYRVTWRQATKSKKCYFKRASTIKVPETISKKYFKGKDQKTIEDIMERALAAWFSGRNQKDV